MGPFVIVGIVFILSLTGAFILFKFFKSTAIIKNKNYQAGGDIAGFILIFGALYGAYDTLEKRGREKFLRGKIARPSQFEGYTSR